MAEVARQPVGIVWGKVVGRVEDGAGSGKEMPEGVGC